MFSRLPDLTVAPDGTIALTIGVETMVTVTSVAGGKKGVPAAPIPASAPFSLPFADDFSSYAEDAMARFFSDQFGSFAVRSGRLTQVAPQNPGALAWSGDADPFTLIGDVSWTDVSVEASVVIGDGGVERPSSGLALADGAPAMLLPCSAGAPEQRFEWNVSAPGYLSGSGSECLNAYGCGRDAVFWTCVTSGGTCCGDACYDGLRFSMTPGGQLVCALPAVGCLTALAGSPPLRLTFADCVSPAPRNQTFVYSAADRSLQLAGGGGLCLSQPPPPPPPVPYAQVCTRIASYAAFSKPRPPPGYCVQLQSSGAWLLTSASGTIANGTIAAPAPGAAVLLRVEAVGSVVSAFADGAKLAAIEDAQHTSGMAGLGSGFHEASFGDFKVAPAT
jgi:hypothetical protein